MDAEDFFTRWSRREPPAGAEQAAPAPQPDPVPAAPEPEPGPPPGLDDVAALDAGSDYSRFMAPEVDEAVRRAAMKKLFTDPHYNMMDGLDVYIEDYNSYVPLAPEILARLEHARSLLDPLAHLGLAAPADGEGHGAAADEAASPAPDGAAPAAAGSGGEDIPQGEPDAGAPPMADGAANPASSEESDPHHEHPV